MNKQLTTAIAIVIVISIIFSASVTYACSGGEDPPSGSPGSPGRNQPDDANKPDRSDCGPQGGDPVDLVRGSFYESVTDLTIPGRSMVVAIKRSYRSGAMGGGAVYFSTSGSFDEYQWSFPTVAFDIRGATTANASCRFTVPTELGSTYTVSVRARNSGYGWSNWVNSSVTVNRSSDSSRFGYGWDMNYNIKILAVDEDHLLLLNGRHGEITYTRVAGSNPKKYLGPTCLDDYIIENVVHEDTPPYSYTLYKSDGTKWQFDGYGRIEVIESRDRTGPWDNGDPSNRIQFSYSGSGYYAKLTTITDDLGRQISLSYYNDTGLLHTITDFDNRTWTYAYNPSTNNLSRVTGPTGLKTIYTYDLKHNRLTAKDANNTVYQTNVYDANMVTQQTVGYGTYEFDYDTANKRATVTSRTDVNTVMTWNDSNNLASEKIFTKGLRTGDPGSYETSYRYNDSNQIELEILPDGKCIYYTYDANGNTTGIYRKTATSEPNDAGDPNVIAELFEYNSKNNFITKKTDAMGSVTDYEYYTSGNGKGNLKKITYPTVPTPSGDRRPAVDFTYTSYGQVETVKDPNGMIIEFEYYTDSGDPNNYGHLKKIIADSNAAGLNIETQYVYDKLGRVREVNDPNNDVAKYVYDANDQLTKVTEPSPYDYVTNFFYNKNKKLRKIEKELPDVNQIFELSYDNLKHVSTVTDPCGFVTKVGYDKSENLSDVNDAEHNKTQYAYDERDLLWKVTDANGGVTEYFYTLNGKLSKIKDAKGNETAYEYDGFDRLKKIIYPGGKYEEFDYDKNSNVTSHRMRKADTIKYWYDAINRITAKKAGSDPNTYYRYDVAGRVYDVNDNHRSVSDGGGITRYYYDRVSRVAQITNPESRVTKYEYNSKGLRSRMVYPDNTSIYYYYDALGRLTKITGSGGTIVEYQYDALSRKVFVSYGSGSYIDYRYDVSDKVRKVTNDFGTNGQIVYEYTEYDKVGNRLNMLVDSNEHTYAYDKLYQLTDVEYYGGSGMTYGYDKLGNRTSTVNGSTISYISNNLNQYTLIDEEAFYNYDDNGNLTTDRDHGYYYDCENRLTQVAGSGWNVYYKYDYLGRLVKRTQGATTSRYVYDGDQIIAEYDGSNNLVRKFVYGPDIDEPVCMIAGSSTYYYHYDGLGSVIALSNADKQIVEQYSYDVFGRPNTTSSIGNPYMFTGRQYDSQAQIYYYRARFYSPALGRFLQPDPVMPYIQLAAAGRAADGKVPGQYLTGASLQNYLQKDPIGRFLMNDPAGRFLVLQTYGIRSELNLYTYCGNNPTLLFDPYGLGIWSWIGYGLGTIGGALSSYAALATAPAWVGPVGVGLLFFGIGNQIGDWMFGGDPAGDFRAPLDYERERCEREMNN